MNMHNTVILILIALLAAHPVRAQQGAGNQSNMWRTFAEKLDPGTLVTVRLTDGSHFKGHLIQVSPEALQVKPKTRIAVPVRAVPLEAIESIQREREGISPGAKVALGVGVGAATFLVLAFLAFMSAD
jgi:hypothetical protein